MLLSYRIPRKLGTPRVTIWRKMKRLGVAQLGDGLVALPATPCTRKHLDGIAEEILQVGGTAAVWLAQSATGTQGRELVAGMAAARSQEYRTVIAHAAAAASAPAPERTRIMRRLRDQLLRIQSRDYFPPAERDIARRGRGYSRRAAPLRRGRSPEETTVNGATRSATSTATPMLGTDRRTARDATPFDVRETLRAAGVLVGMSSSAPG